MAIKTIRGLDLTGKKVLLRTDFNVPLDEEGYVKENERIRAVLPTILFLIEKNAKIIIASHLGRPKGEVIERLKMGKVAKELGSLLDRDVLKADDCIGEEVKKKIDEMKNKDVMMLENLRFHEGEENADEIFAKNLASVADIYVNDAFANSHRDHASMTRITKYMPGYAGLLLEKEVKILSGLMNCPEKPFAAIIGGAKPEKINVIENLLKTADKIIIGGVLANTFLKASGISIGKSLFDKETVDDAHMILEKNSEKIVLPVDAFVADSLEKGTNSKIVKISSIPPESMIGDIGPETISLYKKVLKEAKTIVWGGPIGAFEFEKFSEGTNEIAMFLSGLEARVIVGGGDSGAAIKQLGIEKDISFMSTGGGAFLDFLSGKELLALKALSQSHC